MATINFRHLRRFWAVAKSGTIARASAQLHVTPQSISSQLAGLEEALGTRYFRRVGCGAEMTDIVSRVFTLRQRDLQFGRRTVRRVSRSTIKDQMLLAHRRYRRDIQLRQHPLRRIAHGGK